MWLRNGSHQNYSLTRNCGAQWQWSFWLWHWRLLALTGDRGTGFSRRYRGFSICKNITIQHDSLLVSPKHLPSHSDLLSFVINNVERLQREPLKHTVSSLNLLCLQRSYLIPLEALCALRPFPFLHKNAFSLLWICLLATQASKGSVYRTDAHKQWNVEDIYPSISWEEGCESLGRQKTYWINN